MGLREVWLIFFFVNKTLSFTGHCYWYFIQLFIHALTTSFSTLKYCIELLQFEFLMKNDLKDNTLERACYRDEVHDIHHLQKVIPLCKGKAYWRKISHFYTFLAFKIHLSKYEDMYSISTKVIQQSSWSMTKKKNRKSYIAVFIPLFADVFSPKWSEIGKINCRTVFAV